MRTDATAEQRKTRAWKRVTIGESASARPVASVRIRPEQVSSYRVTSDDRQLRFSGGEVV